MKGAKILQALLGGMLCGLGMWLALSVPYHPRTFRIEAGGCRLVMDIAEPSGDSPKGYVVLLHGISASKKIMAYLAQGFREEGLRVFVPDLPGHGRTSGVFSPMRAEECTESLLHELVTRGLADPERTILAGHSMGGAIALRVASRNPVAGVIAISPAPMGEAPGIPLELVPYPSLGSLPKHSLVMNGAWEPAQIREAAKNLVVSPGDGTSEYVRVPRATHVSILFDSAALEKAELWAAQTLHFRAEPQLPSQRGWLGFLAGFAGILLLAGPFLRELLGSKSTTDTAREDAARQGSVRSAGEWLVLGLGSAGMLVYWTPLRRLRLFEGDYFASFLLILGIALAAMHWRALRVSLMADGVKESGWKRSRPIIAATFGALMLLLLFTAWLDLSLTESWMGAARWARFAPFLAAVLPYHAAEELALGTHEGLRGWRRMALALLLRLAAFGAVLAGVFALHSGQVLLVILAPYFALFCVLQRWGMNVVRQETRSLAATAVFGAILLAGFCLVAFPAT
ncbi:MAG TPA: alpha/beta fold hydrolase [Candidatus Acidoferrum sp.]|nr:alpha/beta fold hydrolase [Candidatus Acidoferrum sp.]